MTSVLIIDDDPPLRTLMVDVLTAEGYSAVALDSLAGVAAAKRAPPDLIVLDVMMPYLSGPQVAAELRTDPRTAGIPILLCTAFTNPEVWFAEMRAVDILAKPFHIEQLIRLVAKHAPQHGRDG